MRYGETTSVEKKREWNLWLTRSASIEASSHGNMSIPRHHKDSEVARTDCWAQFVRNNSVSVAVTSEYLMIRKIIRCESKIMLVYLLRAGFNWRKKNIFLQLCATTLCTCLKEFSSLLSGDHGFDPNHLSLFFAWFPVERISLKLKAYSVQFGFNFWKRLAWSVSS